MRNVAGTETLYKPDITTNDSLMGPLIINATVEQKSLSLDKMGFKNSNNRCTMKVRSYKLILQEWGKGEHIGIGKCHYQA